jgi:hypothetical protein
MVLCHSASPLFAVFRRRTIVRALVAAAHGRIARPLCRMSSSRNP